MFKRIKEWFYGGNNADQHDRKLRNEPLDHERYSVERFSSLSRYPRIPKPFEFPEDPMHIIADISPHETPMINFVLRAPHTHAIIRGINNVD